MVETDPLELTTVITAVAIAIAKSIPDDEELGVWSLAFVQLAATLSTIASQRALIIKREQGTMDQGDMDQANLTRTIIVDEEIL